MSFEKKGVNSTIKYYWTKKVQKNPSEETNQLKILVHPLK
jgi:hypothetical protein